MKSNAQQPFLASLPVSVLSKKETQRLQTSAFGIFINLLVLYRFISKSMSSFYMMCSSKTISNFIVLFCYLIFNGPVSIVRSYYGPDFFNMLLNQIAAYGVYVQGNIQFPSEKIRGNGCFSGPMTQVCISFNRFLVIYFATLAKRKNGRGVTIVGFKTMSAKKLKEFITDN